VSAGITLTTAARNLSGAAMRDQDGSMTRHKFKVGQMVDYNPNRMSLSASSRGYEVRRLLPREGIEFLYRIKSPIETFERVVKEQELSRRGSSS
jgi:hypothetical protein